MRATGTLEVIGCKCATWFVVCTMRDFCFVLMTGNRKHIVVFVCLCRYLCHDTAGCICDTCISCVCDRFARLCIPIVRLWPVCLRVSICSIMHNARARACPLPSADVWQRASLSHTLRLTLTARVNLCAQLIPMWWQIMVGIALVVNNMRRKVAYPLYW